jgi:hypothetical protein
MKAAIIAAIVSAVIASTTATAGTIALITGAQIKNGSIGLADLSAGAKRALRGKRGPRGFAGAPGVQGAAGAPGAPGAAGGFDPSKVRFVSGPQTPLGPGQVVDLEVRCGPREIAISGGVYGNVFGTAVTTITYPSLGLQSATIANDGTIPLTVWATVVCAAY